MTMRVSSAVRGATVLGLIAGLLALPGPALGQDAEPDNAEARQLFDEGEAHFEARRYEAAAETFQRSYDLMRQAHHPNAPLVLFNIGTSLDELPGREADARDAYVRFLAEGDPIHEVVQARSVQVQARIRGLDQVLASSGETSGSAGGISPLGPILLGVGGAALVAGGVLFAGVLGDNDTVLAMCTEGNCPSGSGLATENVLTLAMVTDSLVISGTLIAATGLLLTLLLQEGGDNTTVAAVCASDGCLAVMGGTS